MARTEIMFKLENVRSLQNHDLQRQDLRLWPLLSILDIDFLLQIEMVMWYGDKNGPVNWKTALIVTKNKDVYGLHTENLITSSIISILPPQKVEALGQKNIKTMIHIDECSFVLTEEGKIYSWGSNKNGMCGHGNNAIISYPIEVSGLADKRVIDIKCGYYHVLVLTDDKKMYSWGKNIEGQVGYTDADMIQTPMEVIIEDKFGKKDIQSISCGLNFSMAVTCDGELYGWGTNAYGELGLGDNSEMIHRKPIKIMMDVAIAKVECGSHHTLALTREGLLYAWGANDDGQLGVKNCLNYIPYPTPINTEKIGKVTDIAARYDSIRSVAVNEDKRIYIWGSYLHEFKCYLSPIDINVNNIHDVFKKYKNFIKVHNPCTSLKKHEKFLHMMSAAYLETEFNNPLTADVVLVVTKQSIYIHKNIIMIRCPEMYKELLMYNSKNIIKVESNFTVAAYKSFLKYLYTGAIDLPDEKPLEVYALASLYGDKTFMKDCIQFIKEKIIILNVIYFYFKAIKLKIDELEEFCFNYAINNLTSVVKTKAYAKLPKRIQLAFIIKAADAHAFKH